MLKWLLLSDTGLNSVTTNQPETNLDYQQTDDTLTITIDEEEQAELRVLAGDEDSFAFADLNDFLEPLVCNSELMWINPEDTGDLTDAPMLGILGEVTTENKGPHGAVHVGFWESKPRFQPILQRWAFMDYQVRDPLRDLLEGQQVVFVAE